MVLKGESTDKKSRKSLISAKAKRKKPKMNGKNIEKEHSSDFEEKNSHEGSYPDYTYSLEDDGFENLDTIENSDSTEARLGAKISVSDIESTSKEPCEMAIINVNVVTSQSLLFDRLTSRGRKPQNVSVDDLDAEQIQAAGRKKLIYRDLAMLPANSIVPHVVIINMGTVAFFTDLDVRLDVANESNEKRLYRAMNNPTSPLYQNASFDWSLRNSQYDIPILSHPSAYFVCVVPSNKFTYGTKCGHSIIGKGKSYFRMIRKRCVEMITINVDDCEGSISNINTLNKGGPVAEACNFVDLPPYFIEKTIDGDDSGGFALRCENKEEFEAYVRSRLCGPSSACSHRDIMNNDKDPSLISNTVEDAICRLALFYHASLDKRIPITIVSSKENIMTGTNQNSVAMPALADILKLMCNGRRLVNILPRRKEWIDTLSDELQKNCSLKGDLGLEDMLCLWESPILRKDNNDPRQASIEKPTSQSSENLQALAPPNTEHPDKTNVAYRKLPVQIISRENTNLSSDIYENPISKLFMT